MNVFSVIVAALAIMPSLPSVFLSGQPATPVEKAALARASDLSAAELREAGLFRFESSGLIVLVHKSSFPFQDVEDLTNSLAVLRSGRFQAGIATFKPSAENVISQMIAHVTPGLTASEYAVMPSTRLVIEVNGVRKVVPVDRPGIQQHFPIFEANVDTPQATEPPPPWPDLQLAAPSNVSLLFAKGQDSATDSTAAFALAMKEFDLRVIGSLASLRTAFSDCFLGAQRSDVEHFGDAPIKPGGMNGMTDSMLSVIAMRLQSDPAYRESGRQELIDALRQEGKVVKVVRSLSVVFKVKIPSGGHSIVIRDLPILPPDKS